MVIYVCIVGWGVVVVCNSRGRIISPHLLSTSSYSSFCRRWGGWPTNLTTIVGSPLAIFSLMWSYTSFIGIVCVVWMDLFFM